MNRELQSSNSSEVRRYALHKHAPPGRHLSARAINGARAVTLDRIGAALAQCSAPPRGQLILSLIPKQGMIWLLVTAILFSAGTLGRCAAD